MITKPYSMDEAIAVLAGALWANHKALTKWLKLPRANQERIVRLAFEKGVITHKRGDDEKLH
jgi:hypothetical protein